MSDVMSMSFDDFLSHHGVKGMRWGVRKKDDSSSLPGLSSETPGVKLNAKGEGSIDIAPGAQLQRLVRSNGESLPMKDLTYASFSSYDNAKYIKTIGGKGAFGGGRDQILGIQVTKKITAPSIQDATRIHSDMMLNDAKFREKNTSMLGAKITDKELERIRQSPTGKTAEAWYWQTNVKLTFDKEFDPDAPYVQRRVKEEFTKKGYNAVRDENDVNSKVAKSPIIIFNPEQSLKVTSSKMITDELRRSNKQQLKNYKKNGDAFLKSQGIT